MELEDLKKNWESTSQKSDTQNHLTREVIDQITRKQYQSKIRKILYPELIGGIVCLLGLLFIGLNFGKLDTTLLQIIGLVAVILLILLPIISCLSLKGFKQANNRDKPYIETIRQFAKDALNFQEYQQVNVYLNYLLLVTIIILLPKFFADKDLTTFRSFWLFAWPLGYILMSFFSRRVKKFYSKSLEEAEELLKETSILLRSDSSAN